MKALDLFCGGGGATKGLQNVGFEVCGVDIQDQRRYYIGEGFIQSSALEIPIEWMKQFDIIWASPPCQKYSHQTKQHSTKENNHPDLVDPVRQILKQTGKPYVIENVINAPLREDLMLCGKMFDLEIARHRIFEIEGFSVEQPEHPFPHVGRVITVTGNTGGSSKRDGESRFGTVDEWRKAMEIDWLPARLIKEAVPPAYSEYIAKQMLKENND